MISLPVRLTGNRRARVLVDRPTLEPKQTAGTSRPPRFLGNPKVPAPASETPAGPPSQAGTGGQARPPLARTAGAPTTRPISGLNGPAQDTRCLRFVRRVTPPGRKTRFRLLARLYRVGSRAHWVPPKGFFDASYIAFLLSQAYPGASARRSETPPAGVFPYPSMARLG